VNINLFDTDRNENGNGNENENENDGLEAMAREDGIIVSLQGNGYSGTIRRSNGELIDFTNANGIQMLQINDAVTFDVCKRSRDNTLFAKNVQFMGANSA
jgi:hypothetical protein